LGGLPPPSSAEIEGNLYHCKPITVQNLGLDGKLHDQQPADFNANLLKARFTFDETTGILRFKGGHPAPKKLTVHEIGHGIKSSKSLGFVAYGGFKYISAFYITQSKDWKPITEKFPFYYTDNFRIYTGHCEKL
jgi:hypothetical protein